MPEEERRRFEPIGAGQLELPRCADEFRDLRVGVQARQLVLPVPRRAEHRHVVEPLGHGQAFLFSRHGIQLGQRLVDSTMLGFQDLLQLRVAQAMVASNDPITEPLADLEALADCRNARTSPASRP